MVEKGKFDTFNTHIVDRFLAWYRHFNNKWRV